MHPDLPKLFHSVFFPYFCTFIQLIYASIMGILVISCSLHNKLRFRLTPSFERNCFNKKFKSHCFFFSFYVTRPLKDQRSKDIHLLPYPVPASDEHYKPFNAVYGTKTTEV